MNNITLRPINSYEIGDEICYFKNTRIYCGMIVSVSDTYVLFMPYDEGERDYMAVLKNWTCNWDKTTMNIPKCIFNNFYTQEDLKLEHVKTPNNFLGF
jgi:hypothetical protein